MEEYLTASCCHNDLIGSIAIDTTPLRNAIIAPKGFVPVGLEFFVDRDKPDAKLESSINLLVVAESVVGGANADAIREFVKHNVEIPVYRVRLHLSLTELLLSVLRINVVIQDGETQELHLNHVGDLPEQAGDKGKSDD